MCGVYHYFFSLKSCERAGAAGARPGACRRMYGVVKWGSASRCWDQSGSGECHATTDPLVYCGGLYTPACPLTC